MQDTRTLSPARLSLVIAAILGVQLPAVHATLLTYQIDSKSGYHIGPGGATASDESTDSNSSYSGAYSEYGSYYSNPHTAGAAIGNDSGWMYSRAFGQGSYYQHYSQITQNVMLENDSASAIDYLYNFTITWGSLTADGYYFSSAEEFSRAGYIVDILVNGSTAWSSAFELYTDQAGSSGSGSGQMLGSYDNGYSYYSWGPFSGQLDLGTVAAGATLALSYSIRTYVEGNHLTSCNGNWGVPTLAATTESVATECEGYGGYGYGGYGYGGYLSYAGSTYAQFGDPNGFDGVTSGFTQDNLLERNPNDVSEPGALALLGAGLAGLAFRRRQKKSA